MPPISGVILAGGKSRRLGQDKAFLDFRGRPLIERVLDAVGEVADDLVIVTNEWEGYREFGARLVRDIYPGKASLGGIHAGLTAAHHEQALVVGCDMPFLSIPLLRRMAELAEGADVVLPRYEDYIEPLHAIYHKRCLGRMQQLIEAGDLRISRVFQGAPPCGDGEQKLNIRYLDDSEILRYDPSRISFLNINTPGDLTRAHEMASRARGADG
jgi:molybdenum cofactor guanylyltransferase